MIEEKLAEVVRNVNERLPLTVKRIDKQKFEEFLMKSNYIGIKMREEVYMILPKEEYLP